MAGRPGGPIQIVPETQPTASLLDAHLKEEAIILLFVEQFEGISWLASWLLKNSMVCGRCQNNCRLVKYQQNVDGYRWRCRPCNFTKSIRSGSFFERSHLSLKLILRLIYRWCDDYPGTKIAKELEINRATTVTDWMNFCRDVCVAWVQDNPVELGGLDEETLLPKIVEIDESNFFKRKYNRGRRRRSKWVFGGIEEKSSEHVH